jgi:phosphoglycerate dehydrogenase-like enzyme
VVSSQKILVCTSMLRESDLTRLKKHADVFMLEEVRKGGLLRFIPEVDIMILGSWPKELGESEVGSMQRLKLVQTVFAGVDSLPMNLVPPGAIVCSNAGAYSEEVAEHGMALLLAATRRLNAFLRNDKLSFKEEQLERERVALRSLGGRTVGILGLGGIGSAFARLAEAFGMTSFGYTRHPSTPGTFSGRSGLLELLKMSDVVLVSLPLTRETRALLGQSELEVMKEDSIIVNVARGDIVELDAIRKRLKNFPRFIYATDVGWRVGRSEEWDPKGDLSSLQNYIVTPHVAGINSVYTGRPSMMAVDNVISFLKGGTPRNIVNRSEYL